MKPRVFVTRALPGPAIDQLIEQCELHVWTKDSPAPRKEILKRVQNTNGLLCLLNDTIDSQVLEAAGPELKVVSNYAVGFDNIDVEAATRLKIPVGNTPGVLTETTADLAFALLMAGARRIVEGAETARLSRWQSWSPTLLLGCDVYGATLGILGMGRIGRAMAQRGLGFDMNVIFHDKSNTDREEPENLSRVSFEELLGESDFLSLHVPLNSDTHHIINVDAFRKMKSTSVLINTARGPAVDHDALYDALKNREIAYAALDVTEPEPLPPGHKLHGLANCLILPHLGSASIATRFRMAEIAVKNLLAGLRGEPLPYCVNPQVYRA